MQKRKIPSNKSRLIGQNFSKFEAMNDYLTDIALIVCDTDHDPAEKDINMLNISIAKSQIVQAQEMIHSILGKLSTLELNKTLSKLKGKSHV